MMQAVASLLFILLASVASADPPRFEPPAVGSYVLPPIARVEDHSLVDADGERAPLLGLAPGEVALVSFVYLSCADACPLATGTLITLDRLIAADAALRERVLLVTASFDPERDRPSDLAKLRHHVKPRSRWRFVTAATPAEIASVLEDFGQDAVFRPAAGEDVPVVLRHVLKVFLVDARGDVRNIYSTEYLDERLILNDLKTVLLDQGSGIQAMRSPE